MPDGGRSILYVGPEEGGVARVAHDAANRLSVRGWDVRSVRVPSGGSPLHEARRVLQRERRELETRTIVHVEHGSNDLAAFWFALLAGGIRGDVVTVPHDPPLVVHAPSAGLITRGGRIRDIVAHRVLSPLGDARLRRLYGKRVAVSVVLSERARANWTENRPPAVLVLPHAADIPPRSVAPSLGRHVLFAGYIGASKGLDVLLDAWAHIPSPAVPLVIAGEALGAASEGYLKELREHTAGTGDPPRWVGTLDDEPFFRMIAEAAIVVVPYRRSNPASGIVMAAMAAGRAIVGSDVPAVSDFLTRGRDALIVPAGDVEALKVALETLLGDAALRDRLGAAAAQRAALSHTWDAHCAGLEQAYELAQRELMAPRT